MLQQYVTLVAYTRDLHISALFRTIESDTRQNSVNLHLCVFKVLDTLNKFLLNEISIWYNYVCLKNFEKLQTETF
jgi:hypothetical protein